MYDSCINYERTPEERANQILSWKRDDKSFFASGACHILAFAFYWLHQNEGYKLIFIKPKSEFGNVGTHVYVTDGVWAFDFNGWTKEAELLKVTKKAYSEKHSGWDFKKEVITDNLETWCANNDHRPPAYFAYLPWERVHRYIEKFSPKPPS